MAEFEFLWPGGPRFVQAEHVRLSTDCVLLADFVQPGAAARGIDLGCASGAIALLLLWENPRLHMTGLELEAQAAALAEENLACNGLAARSRVIHGDIRRCRELFPAGSFDLAVANPPYFPVGSGLVSPDPARAAARSELCCTLPQLCGAAAWLLRRGGRFCLVHRPQRLAELFSCLQEAGLEPKRLRLVGKNARTAPSLVLVESRSGAKPGLTVEPPLLLQDDAGGESAEYRRIYRRP